MMRKNTVVATTIFIFGISLFIFHKSSSAALRCVIRRDELGRTYQDCHEVYNEPVEVMPTLTKVFTPTPIQTFTRCGSNTQCPLGYTCFQPPMPICPTGTTCPQLMPAKYCRVVPTNTPIPSKPRIFLPPPVRDGCSLNNTCSPGYTCFQPPMPICPTGTTCPQLMPARYCKPVEVMPTLTKVFTPTPIQTFTRCGSNTQCPLGYTCFQPPMPACPIGSMCPQIMPARYCRPSVCPLRAQGDANCDQLINEADLLELRKKFNNQPLSLGAATDFNLDGKTDMIDYEIWRKSVYQ